MCNTYSIPLSEEIKKKKIKAPSAGAQGVKTVTQNNSRCVNLHTETARQQLSIKNQFH
jgi:hypothetical protein